MNKLLEKLKIEVILYLKRHMQANEKWFIGNEVFDKERMVREVEDETEYGQVMLLDLIILTLDLVMRHKKEADNIKVEVVDG